MKGTHRVRAAMDLFCSHSYVGPVLALAVVVPVGPISCLFSFQSCSQRTGVRRMVDDSTPEPEALVLRKGSC